MVATENEDKVLKVDENQTSIENNETKLKENLYQQKKRKKTSVVCVLTQVQWISTLRLWYWSFNPRMRLPSVIASRNPFPPGFVSP